MARFCSVVGVVLIWKVGASLTPLGVRQVLRVMLERSCISDWKLGKGFSNAIGRPKDGPEKAPGRARKGLKYASLGGFSAQSGRLQARCWRVGRSLNVHGAQDWPGLRVDPDVGNGLPTQRATPPAAEGYPQPAAIGIRQRERLEQRSAAPPRAPAPWAAAADPTPDGSGSSRSPAAPGWRR